MRLEAGGLPRFSTKINPVLGYGRDTDANGKVDAWFLISKDGIDRILKEGQDPIGKDILAEMFIKKYRSSFMMYVTSATTSVLGHLFMTGSAGVDAQEEFYRDWMDLEEMDIYFEKDLKELGSSYNFSQKQYHYQLCSIGYSDLAERMDRFIKLNVWAYGAADVGLWITGGIVFKWGGKLLSKVGLSLSKTAFVASVKETFLVLIEKQKNMIARRLSIFKEKLSAGKIKLEVRAAEKEIAIGITVATWKSALKQTIKAQKTKQVIQLTIKKTIKWPANVMKGAVGEWKYIVMNTGVQIGSEAVARYDDIYDENPLIMSQNILTNPEVMENISFMATDTILMTGISKNLKTTRSRFLASGVIALSNSSVMNFVIKDEANLKRVAFDTAWETIIGNAQVQLDLKSLEYFEKMALKRANPKIKLLGYVVALVDMGVGYVTYSKVTSHLEGNAEPQPEPKVMLIPVLAEH